MLKLPHGLVAASLIAIFAAPVLAQPETVTGELISVRCYLQNKANVGKNGFICANADVKWEGNPAGLLTDTGKIYQLAGAVVADNNAKVALHLGKIVTVTGNVTITNAMPILSTSEIKVVSK